MKHGEWQPFVPYVLMQICVVYVIIVGVVAIMNFLAIMCVGLGASVQIVYIVAPLIAELFAVLMIIPQLQMYVKLGGAWSRRGSVNIPWLSLVGGALAAQLSCKHLGALKLFVDASRNRSHLLNGLLYGNLALIALVALVVSVREKKK
jgi:hypothetical protein